MSASRERKKRLELAAQGQSPKQLRVAAEKKRKKKRAVTGIIATVVVLAVALGCLYGFVIRPNAMPKKTVALRMADHSLSALDFGYYYYDTINAFYQNYGSYLSYLLPDAAAPIDEQVYDEETGKTWADYFMESAADSAKYDYSIYDAAQKAGFTLSAEGEQEIKDGIENLKASVKDNGYSSLSKYLTEVYGKGASEKSYYAYQCIRQTAAEYAEKLENERTYTAEQIQAKDDENPAQYSNVSYRSFRINADDFMEESVVDEVVTEDEDDTESEEETAAKAAAQEAADTAANEMAEAAKGSEDKFIELTVQYATDDNKEYYENTPDATLYSNQAYDNIASNMVDWLYDDSRVKGDTTVIFDGSTGYSVLFFLGIDKNEYNVVNVRQILFSPEKDEDTDEDGTNDNASDAARDAAKADAEALLAKWQSGEATEESFAALSDEQTGGTDGGLYSDVYHGEMVTPFNDWCFDPARKAGDAEVMETEYGYHVIYFVGEGESYRESMIVKDLKQADYDAWVEEVQEGYDYTLEEAGTAYLRTDLVLGSNTAA